MKCIILFLFGFFSASTFAQKSVKKIIAAEGIEKIEIISDEIFNVDIVSEDVEIISLQSTIQGEHYEDISVLTSVENGTLKIYTSYSPFYIPDNDKLAAHKLISVELKITIPQNLDVLVKSSIASVIGYGEFKNIEVGLENGNCQLLNFLGNANLQTKNGFINVTANRNVSGNAASKHGTVINTLPKIGKYLIVAETITGSISLQETK